MKKFIITTIILVLIIGCFVGCSQKQNPQNDIPESFVENSLTDSNTNPDFQYDFLESFVEDVVTDNDNKDHDSQNDFSESFVEDSLNDDDIEEPTPQYDLYKSFVEDVVSDGICVSPESRFWDLNYFEKQNISDKTISVRGKTYIGHYKDSIIDKFNSYTTDLYYDNNYIEFGLRSDTGEMVFFNRMNSEFFDTEPYLDDVNEPEENAIALATEIASGYIDVSKYTRIIQPSDTQYKEKDGKTYEITYYYITFAKEIQGYLSSDFISIKVTSKGNLATIYMGDINAFENKQLNFNKTNVDISISNKVDRVYAEIEISVESQDAYYQRIAVAPNGQVVVCSYVKVFAQDKNKNPIETLIFIVTILDNDEIMVN